MFSHRMNMVMVQPSSKKIQYNSAYYSNTNMNNIVRNNKSSFTNGMIMRIHNVKPGCSSCGK